MQILLPPSEGKTTPSSGKPVDVTEFAIPVDGRRDLVNALVKLCRSDPDSAVATLKLGVRQADEVAVNAALDTAPTAEAAEVYTGVLFDSLGLTGMPAPVRRRADRSILIFSGLWGVVRPDDAIAAYRCAAAVKLPYLSPKGTTPVVRYWRDRLGAVLDERFADEFVLDLRSSAYVPMWRPQRAASVRVLHEREVAGKVVRTVVSHFNKATKGRLVARLLADDVDCRDAAELMIALKDLGYRVEPDGERLDIVVSEL